MSTATYTSKRHEAGIRRGDRVRVTGKTVTGVRVEKAVGEFINAEDWARHPYIILEDHANTDQRQGVYCEVFLDDAIESIEKYVEEPVTKFKAGDKVKVADTAATVNEGYVDPDAFGKVGTVTEYSSEDNVAVDFGNYFEQYIAPKYLTLVVEEPKPKKQSKKVKLSDLQVGDLIVTFRDSSGVELRRKGVVGHIDARGATTEEFGLLVGHSTQHIYLLERPTPPAEPLAEWEKELLDPDYIADGTYYVVSRPGLYWTVDVKDGEATWHVRDREYTVTTGMTFLREVKSGEHSYTFTTENPVPPAPKGFDALDKSKVYFVEGKSGVISNFYLGHKHGRWAYGFDVESLYTGAEPYEPQFTNGEGSWKVPVEYVAPEPTWQEKLEAAGHSVEDRWVGLLSHYTYRINGERGTIEALPSEGYEWKHTHDLATFLRDLGERPEAWLKIAR